MKIAVVGAGLGGCITAMYYGSFSLIDPTVEIRPAKNQVDDLMHE